MLLRHINIKFFPPHTAPTMRETRPVILRPDPRINGIPSFCFSVYEYSFDDSVRFEFIIPSKLYSHVYDRFITYNTTHNTTLLIFNANKSYCHQMTWIIQSHSETIRDEECPPCRLFAVHARPCRNKSVFWAIFSFSENLVRQFQAFLPCPRLRVWF